MDDFNTFRIMANSYRAEMEKGTMSEEEAAPEIRIYDFLATCNEKDFERLVDTGAFNEIMRAYAERALVNGSTAGLFEISAAKLLKWYYDNGL